MAAAAAEDSLIKAKAFWMSAKENGELRESRLEWPPHASQPPMALVKALYSGISRGTESLVWHCRVPPSEYQRMRAPFQQGEFPAPVKYGYASVGQVEEGPEELLGQTVFCLFPHQERYVVPVDALMPLPAMLPPERAVLAANMETAINGVWDAAPSVGDRIAVVGAGVVGSLVAWLCQAIPGTQVSLIDINPQREALARELGVAFAMPGQAPSECDCVIHASGNPEGLRQALTLAGPEASVIEMSWYGEREVTLSLGEAFHSRRLTLRSSQVGRLPTQCQPRWGYRRRLELALCLLQDPCLDALISGESDFSELPRRMATILAPGSTELCHRVRYL
ncbi:zinc-binding alcohol dehydrogenase [Halomonas sediminis]